MRQEHSESTGRHLIITVHGIQTFGQWQERLEKLLEAKDHKIEVFNYKYGYFSIIAFLVPFLRWLVTKRFRRDLLQQITRARWNRIDLVGHSFGTHLIGWGLYGIKPENRPRIHTVILAGSVLKQWFPWEKLLGVCVGRVVNDCGIDDGILLLNQIFVLFTGMAGRMGFAGMTCDDFRNRFFDFGHSGYFQKHGKPDDAFMREKWVPLLLGVDLMPTFDDPRPPTAVRGLGTFLLNNAEPLKLVFYITPLILLILYINGLRLEAIVQRQIAVTRNLASQSLLELQRKNDERAALLARQAFMFDNEIGGRTRAQVDYALRRVLGTKFFRNTLGNAKSSFDWPYSVAFSSDGRLLASGSAEGLVRLWDLTRPLDPPRVLCEQKGKVMSVSFSPDGKMLGSGGDDPEKSGHSLRLWELARLDKPPRAVDSFKSNVNSVAFSHDSQLLAAGGEDGTILVTRLSQPDSDPISLNGHHRGQVSVAFSPTSNLLSTGGSEGTVNLWDVDNPSAAPAKLLGSKTSIHAVAFSPDGHTLAAGSGGPISGVDDAVRLWDLSDLSRAPAILKHDFMVKSIDFSPDGKLLASGSSRVKLWDWSRGRSLATLGSEDAGWVETVRFSPDGRRLVSANGLTLFSKKDIGVHLWNLGHPVGQPFIYGKHESISNVAFSPDGKTMASGDFDGTVRLWTIGSGDTPRVLSKEKVKVNGTYTVAFNTEGTMLVSGGADGILRVWNLREPSIGPTEMLAEPHGPIRSLAFGPLGSVVALSITGTDRTESEAGSHSVVLLDIVEGKIQKSDVLARTDSACNSLAFSPDGKLLACGNNDGTVNLWDLQRRSGTPTVLKGHKKYVWSVSFSHDGKVLASGGNDEKILLWAIGHPDRPRTELVGHERGVRSLAFSNNNKTLASGSDDRTARLWNLEKLELPPVVLQHGARVAWVAFHPNDPILAAASGNSFYIWLASTELLANFVCEMVWRDLSPDEWSMFVGSGIRQRPTCK